MADRRRRSVLCHRGAVRPFLLTYLLKRLSDLVLLITKRDRSCELDTDEITIITWRHLYSLNSASDSTCTQYCRRSALYKLLCMYVCMYVRNIKTAEKRTITQQYGDWYTGLWRLYCYIWYSDKAPPSPLLAVPIVTAHPSTASMPTSYYSIWKNNCLSTIKG